MSDLSVLHNHVEAERKVWRRRHLKGRIFAPHSRNLIYTEAKSRMDNPYFRLTWGRKSGKLGSTLVDLIERYAHNECTDPRDHVFGLLSLSNHNYGIEADYTQPLACLLVDLIHQKARSDLRLTLHNYELFYTILQFSSIDVDDLLAMETPRDSIAYNVAVASQEGTDPRFSGQHAIRKVHLEKFETAHLLSAPVGLLPDCLVREGPAWYSVTGVYTQQPGEASQRFSTYGYDFISVRNPRVGDVVCRVSGSGVGLLYRPAPADSLLSLDERTGPRACFYEPAVSRLTPNELSGVD